MNFRTFLGLVCEESREVRLTRGERASLNHLTATFGQVLLCVDFIKSLHIVVEFFFQHILYELVRQYIF